MIPAHRIVFTDEEVELAMARTEDIMRSGQVILGSYTEAFEKEYAKLHGRKYGVAVASDTAAIEIALRIYGINEGKHVLFPANGFYGIVIPILRCGAKPIFFDVNIEENIFATEQQIEQLIREHYCSALILMHTGGLVASRSKQIAEVCKKYGVVCIEDAAHAPGAKMNGQYAGSFGDISCFSLYATKPINAGEGGILLTDNKEHYELAKTYRNYGRVSTFGTSVCQVQGYSWRLTEIQAAIGLEQVRRQDEISKERNSLAFVYDAMVKERLNEHGIYTYEYVKGTEPNWYRYLVMLPEGFTQEDKVHLKKFMKEVKGVEMPGDVYEMPVPYQPVYGDEYAEQSFPMASDWCNRHLALPIYNTLTHAEMAQVVEGLEDYMELAMYPVFAGESDV